MKTKFEVVPEEPSEIVITQLEQLLEMAKSGEIRGFAAAISLKGDRTTEITCLGSGAYVVSLLGALRILEREFIDLHIDLTCRNAGDGRRV